MLKPILLTVARRKPRNPLVAAARLRRAGPHRRDGGALRLRAGQTLKRELDPLPEDSP